MSRKHTQALVALTKTVPAFASKTFVTRAKYAPPNELVKVDPPYVVWHPAQGTNDTDRFTAPKTVMHPRFTGHIVGETADQVQLLADLLEAAIFPGGRGVLTVAGEAVRDFWYESPLPIQVSTDPLPEVIYLVVECGWTADPV